MIQKETTFYNYFYLDFLNLEKFHFQYNKKDIIFFYLDWKSFIIQK